MVPYLDRDLSRHFWVIILGLLLFIQVGIFVSFLMNLYADVFSGGGKFGWFLMYFLFSMPRQLANTIPVAIAVTVLLVYTLKTRTNEILAYLVGGVSPMRLAAPLLFWSFLVALGAWSLTEYLANAGDAAAERIKRVNIEGRTVDALTREKNVFQKGLGSRFYSVRSFQPTQNRMETLVVFEMDAAWQHPVWRLEAKQAELIEVPGSDVATWHFEDIVYRTYGPNGTVTGYRTEATATEADIFPPDVRLEKELARYIRQRFRPSQMRLTELREYIDLFRLQGKTTWQLETHFHFNIAIPMGGFVLACLMVGHILRPAATGVIVGFGGGLILVAAYYILLLFAREASMKGTIPAALGAYGTNLLFLGIAVMLLHRNRRL